MRPDRFEIQQREQLRQNFVDDMWRRLARRFDTPLATIDTPDLIGEDNAGDAAGRQSHLEWIVLPGVRDWANNREW
jgi:hypothetical protein